MSDKTYQNNIMNASGYRQELCSTDVKPCILKPESYVPTSFLTHTTNTCSNSIKPSDEYINYIYYTEFN